MDQSFCPQNSTKGQLPITRMEKKQTYEIVRNSVLKKIRTYFVEFAWLISTVSYVFVRVRTVLYGFLHLLF